MISSISHFHLQANIQKADFNASRISHGSRGLLTQKASSTHLIANGNEITESVATGIEDTEVYDASDVGTTKQEAEGDSTSLVLSNVPSETTADGLTAQELMDMDQQVSQALDPDEGKQALEVWQDLNVIARKVIKHAKDVLQREDQDILPEAMEPARAHQDTPQPEVAHQDTTQPVAAQKEQVEPRAANQGNEKLGNLQEVGRGRDSALSIEATPKPSITYVNSTGDVYQIPYKRVREWDVCNL